MTLEVCVLFAPCISLRSFQKSNCLWYFLFPESLLPFSTSFLNLLHITWQRESLDVWSNQCYLMVKCADVFQMHATHLYLFRKQKNLVARAYHKATSNTHSPCISTSSPGIFNYLLWIPKSLYANHNITQIIFSVTLCDIRIKTWKVLTIVIILYCYWLTRKLSTQTERYFLARTMFSDFI